MGRRVIATSTSVSLVCTLASPNTLSTSPKHTHRTPVAIPEPLAGNDHNTPRNASITDRWAARCALRTAMMVDTIAATATPAI